MADYLQTPHRPNIKPTGLPPINTAQDKPIRPSSGLVPALGAVAVVGIVALVAWGVLDNDADGENSQAPAAVTQTLPTPEAVAPDAAAPDTTATPTPAPMEAPDVTPLEVPTPAPEVIPAPVPAPTN